MPATRDTAALVGCLLGGLLLVGCDRLFSLSDVVLESDAPPAPPGCFDENFDTGMFDSTRWHVVDRTNSIQVVSVVNQQLAIELKPKTLGTNGIRSLSTYDLTNNSFEVTLVKPVSTAYASGAFLQVTIPGSPMHHLHIIQSSAMTFSIDSDRAVVEPYSEATDKHWRIRHDGTMLHFETSADGTTFVDRRTAATSFDLRTVFVELDAAEFETTNAVPGEARFDDFKLVTGVCP